MTAPGALSRTQHKVLACIQAFVMAHGHMPTVREIAADIGSKSTGNVHAHIQSLIVYGALARRNGRIVLAGSASAISIVLPSDLDRQVRALALKAGVTPQAIVAECVRDAVFARRSQSASRETETSRAPAVSAA